MNETKLIEVSLIDNPGHDARIGLDQKDFHDLVESIRENGILQPILVRQRGVRYEVIAGNRRLQAVRGIGSAQIPCLVRDASDYEVAVFKFEENLKRADINPVEQAKYIAETISKLDTTVEEFAVKINRSVDWVNNRLAIATMPEYMQGYLIAKRISLGVALPLNEINDETVRKNWTNHAAEQGMSVSGARSALREYSKIERAKAEAPENSSVPTVSATPPVAYVSCVRCGTSRPMQQTKFVRICDPICPSEEGARGAA